MKRLILLAVILSVFISCEREKPTPAPGETEHTLFMYLPWSTDLKPYFEQNITDLETSLNGNVLKNNKVIVFISSTPTKAEMFELKYEKGKFGKGKKVRVPLKEYDNPALTTSAGITSILNDVVSFAPAKRYSMTIGCHGMGWVPVSATSRTLRGDFEKFHYEYEGEPLTRFFGSGYDSQYQTNITTLAEGIVDAGLKMEYILFDDCYMSSIEVAYDLMDATRHLIACPTEIMAYGFPYHLVGKDLINSNYQGICSGFYQFYANYDYPYGTIAMIDCTEVEELASIMRQINQNYTFNPAKLESLQRMDGYNPVIFFDLMHYVENLCSPETELFARFSEQYERTVPADCRFHTPYYFTSSYVSGSHLVMINEFSGVTISDPSVSQKAAEKTATAWYHATH